MSELSDFRPGDAPLVLQSLPWCLHRLTGNMASVSPRPRLLQRQHSFSWERGSVLSKRKIAWSLLIWLLGLPFIFVLSALYSPHPFRLSPLALLDGPADDQVLSLTKSQASCDLIIGRWALDPGSGPADPSTNSAAIPELKNCAKQGKGMDLTNWIWKPRDCELPLLDPRAFLGRVRGKMMAFLGDSAERNQFDSLICLLSEVESPISIYKDQDDNRFRSWRFSAHNFTLAILWTRFLVSAYEQEKSGSATGVLDLHLDKIDLGWIDPLNEKLDFVVISSGHWLFRKLFLYDNTLIGCVFCSKPNITSINVSNTTQKLFR